MNSLTLAKSIIDSIRLEDDELSDDSLMKLQIIFPENLIIAALDLIDRGSVIHRITPWGHTEYEVLGSTATYTILPDLDAAPRVPYSCTCPSFIYAVLLSETHIMCKHVLATFLARKLSLCIERPTDLDDLSVLYNLNFTLAESETTTELQ
ncbi:hypothetical protein BYT27DRAFT_7191244 [Phlegmacium glaucopus]|nr:hypothetical protein BYT27DRAFT_7191244 [Phlegmacium glaucopus]